MKPTAKQLAYIARLQGGNAWDQPKTSEAASVLIKSLLSNKKPVKERWAYERSADKVLPTADQLAGLQSLCDDLDRKMPQVDTKAEAQDAIDLYILIRDRGPETGPPPTAKQQNYIRFLDPNEAIPTTKSQASDLIGRLLRKQKRSLTVT